MQSDDHFRGLEVYTIFSPGTSCTFILSWRNLAALHSCCSNRGRIYKYRLVTRHCSIFQHIHHHVFPICATRVNAVATSSFRFLDTFHVGWRYICLETCLNIRVRDECLGPTWLRRNTRHRCQKQVSRKGPLGWSGGHGTLSLFLFLLLIYIPRQEFLNARDERKSSTRRSYEIDFLRCVKNGKILAVLRTTRS